MRYSIESLGRADAVSRIEKQSLEWREKGFITEEQRTLIISHEATKVGRNWIALGIAGIGVVALAAGVISIIAANWDAIGDNGKLITFLLVQIGLAVALWKHRETSSVTREVLLSLFVLFWLGGIGLVGQMYHLESDGTTGLTMWLLMTFPLLLFAENMLINHIWFIVLIIDAIVKLSSSPPITLQRELEGVYYASRLYGGFALAFLLLAVGYIRRYPCAEYFRKAALRWGWIITLGVGTIMANCFFAFGTPYNFYAPMIGASVWASAAISSIPLFLFSSPVDRPQWRIAVACTIVTSAAAITLPSVLAVTKGVPLQGLIWFLIPWGCAAWASALHRHQRLFNFITFLIASRFIFSYFEVFGSMAATGIGLIVSGLVILGLLKIWFVVRARYAITLKEVK